MYYNNHGKRYHFGKESVTYSQAVEKCTAMCGTVFEPKTMDTNKKVFAAAKPIIGTTMWIGIHDINNEGRYIEN
jgi:hypothetical protein